MGLNPCKPKVYLRAHKFKKVGEHRSERNEIASSQLADTGELITINTAYCDKFLGNTQRNLIWNNIDYILYNVVRRAIAARFDFAQGSHQATCTVFYCAVLEFILDWKTRIIFAVYCNVSFFVHVA